MLLQARAPWVQMGWTFKDLLRLFFWVGRIKASAASSHYGAYAKAQQIGCLFGCGLLDMATVAGFIGSLWWWQEAITSEALILGGDARRPLLNANEWMNARQRSEAHHQDVQQDGDALSDLSILSEPWIFGAFFCCQPPARGEDVGGVWNLCGIRQVSIVGRTKLFVKKIHYTNAEIITTINESMNQWTSNSASGQVVRSHELTKNSPNIRMSLQRLGWAPWRTPRQGPFFFCHILVISIRFVC